MQIKNRCTICEGTGQFTRSAPGYPTETGECVVCGGLGYATIDIIADEVTAITETLDDIKTKLNHLKNKVDDIWDKVK